MLFHRNLVENDGINHHKDIRFESSTSPYQHLLSSCTVTLLTYSILYILLHPISTMNGDSNVQIDNYIGGKFVPPATGVYQPVHNPADSSTIGMVALSTGPDVAAAVAAAEQALPAWSNLTIKARAAIMLRFHALVREHSVELAELIVQENGKNITEALADVAKGNETVEYACSLPVVATGQTLRVSSAVKCEDRRVPLGVVASIVPFNFPFMVPMWTMPIALVMGNTFILKPSEKVPLTMNKVADLIEKAGFPPGVFNMVHGSKDAVQALIANPTVKAVTFVGSSPVAQIVSKQCGALNKRCTALGGAKNHLVALPDCNVEDAASDICVSFAGCAGQRCMAASVLLTVGQQDGLVAALVEKAAAIEPGAGPGQLGPVIDEGSYHKIMSYIADAEESGAKILLDGRSWKRETGCWVGPTIIVHQSSQDKAVREEVFGPVLSIYVCQTWEEAVAIENASPFGNAASIYTTNGGNADWFVDRFTSAMLGVNIGIPVPREPFSFGGLYGTASKYGDMDITGGGGMEFFSHRIKISSKWPMNKRTATQAGLLPVQMAVNGGTDHANFAGTM
jgi:malonate-semialdehyde dehydrogenase (acetylating)/methylmalonate-semialdehyde dehydrogenase